MLERGWSCDIHVPEPVHGDGVAGHPVQRRDGADRAHWLHAPARRGPRGAVPVGLVGPAVGSHGLRAGRRGEIRVRHGRLRHGLAGVRRPRRRDARHARGVHAGRRRPQRLLRRQPRGRLQPAHPRGARRQQRDDVRGGRVRGRFEHAVPRGAQGRGRRGVPERVRRVREARVLLQRRVREPQHVPPHDVLAGLQVRVPALLQLRLRRPHQHLHLRRRPRLHHHLLPRRHPKPQVRGWSNGDTDADDARSEHVWVSGDAEANRRARRRRRPRCDAGQQLMARQPSHRRRVGGDDVKDGNDPSSGARTIHAPVDPIGLDHRKKSKQTDKQDFGQGRRTLHVGTGPLSGAKRARSPAVAASIGVR